MARVSTITFEQVAASANSLKAGGNKATSRAIRENLGTGSMATICKHLAEWQGTQVRQTHVIDDTIDPTISRAISGHIAAKVQEATADATARLADLQTENAIIINESERQATEAEENNAEIAVLLDQNTALTGRIQQLEIDSSQIKNELVAERKGAESARIELAKTALRLEAVPRIEAEIVLLRAELLLAQKQAAEQHEAAAVATARLEAEVILRKSIEAQLIKK